MTGQSNRQASTKSTKALLSGHLSNGSSETELDTAATVGFEETEETHHYADPQELKHEIQKKKNLLYESLSMSGGKQPTSEASTEESNSYLRYSHNDRLYRFLFVVVFLMSFGAFLLSILTSFGIINNCPSCINVLDKSADKLTNSVDHLTLPWLNRNLTELREIVIPSLLRQVSILEAKMKNESLHGKPGPEGPPGVAGPPGAGDLSKCEYRTDATSSSYGFDKPEKMSEVITLKTSAKDGFIIMGASCTTIGGSEYGLFQELRNGKREYYCKCAGKSNTMAFAKEVLHCRIHLWECPIKS